MHYGFSLDAPGCRAYAVSRRLRTGERIGMFGRKGEPQYECGLQQFVSEVAGSSLCGGSSPAHAWLEPAVYRPLRNSPPL